MAGAERVLIAAAHGKAFEPVMRRKFEHAELQVAESASAVQRLVRERMRFDVVVSDLYWPDRLMESSFDGLDVLETLRASKKNARVIFSSIGIPVERDYLDEAVQQPETVGVCSKLAGPGALCEAIQVALTGSALPSARYPLGGRVAGRLCIHDYFGSGGSKGRTAARLAGAIASGRAVDHATLAQASMMSRSVVNRLTDYLGPLIMSRGEHRRDTRMTPEAVYRWCGIHGQYILSWCRRNENFGR